ncbi:hypothetical protein B6S12_07715 [Helicobacter valdiviensis]|uniref:Porin n=1 Tax=Helicobacter valdiviensis TaxID=1458358 RepID=A0A2W6NF92_9HELI|nr:major outer membrane protein [Helicobacter valdiviensis]PZT47670.1 hypothetical protein B6S12_07715 [Helicobacter valdiviensis]
MKFLKLSLATSVAIAGLSSVSLAQPLEEAIKGIDVSGMLRYRYTDNRYKDRDFTKDNSDRGDARHQWRADVLFKTPVINAVSFNLGIGYHNAQQNVNHENNAGTGSGLGSGSDGWFGVREFNALITPESTATSVKVGKMIMTMPISDTLDDRGTGILATNSDLPHWTFVVGAYDSWSVDDIQGGYWLTPKNESFTKPLYTIAAISNYETNYGNFGSQLWFYGVKDMVDAGGFGELSWSNNIFHLKGQYAFAKLNNDEGSVWRDYYLNIHPSHRAGGVKEANDLYTLEAGVRFHEFNVPVALNVGYWGNTQDGFSVAFDNEGAFQKYGQIWFESAATGVDISMFNSYSGEMPHGYESNELSVMYANLNYDILENLNIGIDYIYGKNKQTRGIPGRADRVGGDIEFQEINPNITWQYSKPLKFAVNYSFLTTDKDNTLITDDPNASGQSKEKRDRIRFEARYNF